jgi:predicted TIM-barrel fold metal-dependent hydrolase
MMSVVIVDAWMQHPTPRFLEHAMFDSLRRWTGQALAPEEVPIDATVAAMDAAGVHVGMLSAWRGPEGSLIANDEVAGWIAEHPDRFRGLAAVDLRRPLPAVRELRRCVSELGFRGLRIVNWLWELPPTDRRCYPLYTAAEEMGVPVCLQVGHTGPLKPSEFGRPIPYVDQVAIDFPDLTLVCGHIGYPWTEEMVAVARKHPNVVIDTSAYTVRRYPPELVAYLKADGGEKVLWGTNFPMIPHEKAMLGIEDLGLDDAAREAFLGGNAARVFSLAAPD